MPRKSATSAAIATTDPSGDVTMIPEAPPTVLPSSPKAQQAAKEEAPKQSKKKEQQTSQQQQSDVVSLDVCTLNHNEYSDEKLMSSCLGSFITALDHTASSKGRPATEHIFAA